MNTTSEQAEFLNWKLTPARLNAIQAAWFEMDPKIRTVI